MRVFLDDDGFVSALEEVPGPVSSVVEELGVHTVQLPHAEGEVPVGGLDEEMVVIVHEAIGMADPVVAFVDMLERPEKVLTVLIVLEDGLLLVAAGGHMVDSAGVFDAKRAGHRANIAAKA